MQSVVGRNSLSSALPLCPQIVPLRLCSSALAAQLLIAGDSLGTKVAPPKEVELGDEQVWLRAWARGCRRKKRKNLLHCCKLTK